MYTEEAKKISPRFKPTAASVAPAPRSPLPPSSSRGRSARGHAKGAGGSGLSAAESTRLVVDSTHFFMGESPTATRLTRMQSNTHSNDLISKDIAAWPATTSSQLFDSVMAVLNSQGGAGVGRSDRYDPATRIKVALDMLGKGMRTYEAVFGCLKGEVETMVTQNADLQQRNDSQRQVFDAMLKERIQQFDAEREELLLEISTLKKGNAANEASLRSVRMLKEHVTAKEAELTNAILAANLREESDLAARRSQDQLFAQFSSRNKMLEEELTDARKEYRGTSLRADELQQTCQRYAQRLYGLEKNATQSQQDHARVVDKLSEALKVSQMEARSLLAALNAMKALKRGFESELATARDELLRMQEVLEDREVLLTPRPRFRGDDEEGVEIEVPLELQLDVNKNVEDHVLGFTTTPFRRDTRVRTVVLTTVTDDDGATNKVHLTSSDKVERINQALDQSRDEVATLKAEVDKLRSALGIMDGVRQGVREGQGLLTVRSEEGVVNRKGPSIRSPQSTSLPNGITPASLTVVPASAPPRMLTCFSTSSLLLNSDEFKSALQHHISQTDPLVAMQSPHSPLVVLAAAHAANLAMATGSASPTVHTLYRVLKPALSVPARQLRPSTVTVTATVTSILNSIISAPTTTVVPLFPVMPPVLEDYLSQTAAAGGTISPSAGPFLPLILQADTPTIQCKAMSLPDLLRTCSELFEVYKTQCNRTSKRMELHVAIVVHLLDTSSMISQSPAPTTTTTDSGSSTAPKPTTKTGLYHNRPQLPASVTEQNYSLLVNLAAWSSNPRIDLFNAMVKEEVGTWAWGASSEFVAMIIYELDALGEVSLARAEEELSRILRTGGSIDEPSICAAVWALSKTYLTDTTLKEAKLTRATVDHERVSIRVDAAKWRNVAEQIGSTKPSHTPKKSHPRNASPIKKKRPASVGSILAKKTEVETAFEMCLRHIYLRRLRRFYAMFDSLAISRWSRMERLNEAPYFSERTSSEPINDSLVSCGFVSEDVAADVLRDVCPRMDEGVRRAFLAEVIRQCRIQHRAEVQRAKERSQEFSSTGMASGSVFHCGWTRHFFIGQYARYPVIVPSLLEGTKMDPLGSIATGVGWEVPAAASLRDSYDPSTTSPLPTIKYSNADGTMLAGTDIGTKAGKKGGLKGAGGGGAVASSGDDTALLFGELVKQVPLVLLLRMVRKVPIAPLGMREDDVIGAE